MKEDLRVCKEYFQREEGSKVNTFMLTLPAEEAPANLCQQPRNMEVLIGITGRKRNAGGLLSQMNSASPGNCTRYWQALSREGVEFRRSVVKCVDLRNTRRSWAAPEKTDARR